MALWIVDVLVAGIASAEEGSAIALFINLNFCGLQIWLGIKGNEMTAKNLLEHRWEFTEPGSDAVRDAKYRWSLASKSFDPTQIFGANVKSDVAIVDKLSALDRPVFKD